MKILQQAFETCQADKSAWLQRRAELAQTGQAYREQLAGSGHSGRSLQTLREIIDVKKWEINQAAGRYIRSHEEVQRISIRDRLNDFMQAHGADLAAALAPELMNYSGQHPAIQRCAMQHSLDYLREALQLWLAAGEKINYAAQDNNILTAIGFRPDAASRDDSREKFTPAQNLNYTRRRAELAVQ
ncbi:Polarity suppression protein [Cronobacter dublinensis subsp. dublinensis]|nr:Polarity suppression protein [Cronobacter dublinensis subsp. dublinensis]EGT5735253.1 Polarity suppression protein [Cronobacter dublinensis subsp. dublinensis]